MPASCRAPRRQQRAASAALAASCPLTTRVLLHFAAKLLHRGHGSTWMQMAGEPGSCGAMRHYPLHSRRRSCRSPDAASRRQRPHQVCACSPHLCVAGIRWSDAGLLCAGERQSVGGAEIQTGRRRYSRQWHREHGWAEDSQFGDCSVREDSWSRQKQEGSEAEGSAASERSGADVGLSGRCGRKHAARRRRRHAAAHAQLPLTGSFRRHLRRAWRCTATASTTASRACLHISLLIQAQHVLQQLVAADLQSREGGRHRDGTEMAQPWHRELARAAAHALRGMCSAPWSLMRGLQGRRSTVRHCSNIGSQAAPCSFAGGPSGTLRCRRTSPSPSASTSCISSSASGRLRRTPRMRNARWSCRRVGREGHEGGDREKSRGTRRGRSRPAPGARTAGCVAGFVGAAGRTSPTDSRPDPSASNKANTSCRQAMGDGSGRDGVTATPACRTACRTCCALLSRTGGLQLLRRCAWLQTCCSWSPSHQPTLHEPRSQPASQPPHLHLPQLLLSLLVFCLHPCGRDRPGSHEVAAACSRARTLLPAKNPDEAPASWSLLPKRQLAPFA